MAKAKKIEKEKRILEAAEEVFSKYGYTQATLDEIIKIADTGKGTIYNYFGNKEQLFYRLMENKNTIFITRLEEAINNADTFEEKFKGYFAVLVDFITENRTLWQVLHYEMLGSNKGIQVSFSADGSPEIINKWGVRLNQEEERTIIRYTNFIFSEFSILDKIIRDYFIDRQCSCKNNLCDENKRIDIVISILFGGTLMSIFFNKFDGLTGKEVAEFLMKTFLYGHGLDGESKSSV